ncbi:hypothetical protein STRSA0001_0748 [Streptococcus salivarius SK126]|nr:hypothetical protein STRSA0001_0748 [Streptococcus salivarius SK126]
MRTYTSFHTTLLNLVFVHFFFKDGCHDFTQLLAFFFSL